MRVDGSRVEPCSAHTFRAFGGEYGVRMNLIKKNGVRKVVEGIEQMFVFGSFGKEVADRLVSLINRRSDDAWLSSEELIECARMPMLPKVKASA